MILAKLGVISLRLKVILAKSSRSRRSDDHLEQLGQVGVDGVGQLELAGPKRWARIPGSARIW